MTAVADAPPSPRFMRGDPWRFRVDPLGYLAGLAERHASPVAFSIGHRRYWFVSDPAAIDAVLTAGPEVFPRADAARQIAEALGKGLVTTDGPEWRAARVLLQPLFRPAAVADYRRTMESVAFPLIDCWCSPGKREVTVNITERCFEIAMSVASKTLLGSGDPTVLRDLRRALAHLGRFIMNRITAPLRLPLRAPWPSHLAFRRHLAIADTILYAAISEAAAGGERSSAVARLLDAASDVGAGTAGWIRDHIITLFLAGFDTTAAALGFSCSLLAQHDTIQEEVRAELRATGDPLRANRLREVVLEALRLYPPVPLFSRVCRRDVRLGGLSVPVGTEVWVSPYVTHRLEPLWPDANVFRPHRWEGETRDVPVRPGYLPFGRGAHTCIGASFAIQEILLALGRIVSRYVLSDPRPLPEPVARISLGMRRDVWCQARPADAPSQGRSS